MTHKSVSNGTRTMSLFGIIGQPGIVQHMTTSKLEQEIECVAWGKRRTWMIIPSLDNKLWQNKRSFWFKLQGNQFECQIYYAQKESKKKNSISVLRLYIMVMQFLSAFMDRFLLYEIIRVWDLMHCEPRFQILSSKDDLMIALLTIAAVMSQKSGSLYWYESIELNENHGLISAYILITNLSKREGKVCLAI
jgi:hypothetical protein